MAVWMLISTLFAADAPKAAPAKVYVVYVTVVEVDAEGNETVLFTPKVQTTGNPAGATVEHVDGRMFEFNCKMEASTEPALEKPPVVMAKKPFLLTVGSKGAKEGTKSRSSLSAGSAVGRRADEGIARGRGDDSEKTSVKRVPPIPDRLLDGGEGTKQTPKADSDGGTAPQADARPAGEYSVRTYDVSTLLDAPRDKPLTEAHFAPLIETIKSFTEVETWTAPAAIKPFISTKSLVIKQTADGHKAIAEALEKLQSHND